MSSRLTNPAVAGAVFALPLPLLLLQVLLQVLLLAGCTPERDPLELFVQDGVGQLVVEGVLIVDQPLPAVRLSRTMPPQEPFSWEEAREDGAAVVILVDGREEVPYRQSWLAGGVYVPMAYEPPVVQPSTTYELVVTTGTGESLRAVTTTPRRFAVDSWTLLDPEGREVLRDLQTFREAGGLIYEAPENQLAYGEGLLETRFTGTTAADLEASGFQLALFSLDLGSDYVIDPPFFEDEDFESLDRVGSSPAVTAERGAVRLPWFSIYYEGRHLYKVFAVDRNWFDYIRSVPEADVGLGFGGNAGDNFASPIFNVDGGIGLFASGSVDSVGFTIHPAE